MSTSASHGLDSWNRTKEEDNIMGLREQIQQDLNKAMLAKETETTGTLRLFFAAVQNKEKEKRYAVSKKDSEATPEDLEMKSKLTAEELLDVLGAEAKKRRESIEAFDKGDRKEMADKERRELAILEAYLPSQLTEQEILVLVKEAVSETKASNPKDMGKVMAALMPKVKGKADGSIVSRIVKEQLDS